MLFDQINLQEAKKAPENIYDFFESIFGHEIFFIQDLMALKGENKELFKKFFGPTEDSSKRAISMHMLDILTQQPGRIEKFPFSANFRIKNTVSLTAFRVSSASNSPLTREIATRVFEERFADIIADLPDRKEEEKKISEEENAYYEKLKLRVRGALDYQQYFELQDCPVSGKRERIIRKLLKFGLIKYKNGGPTNPLENCTFTLPEN